MSERQIMIVAALAGLAAGLLGAAPDPSSFFLTTLVHQ